MDPINKKMVLTARNVTFRNVASIEETCTYTVSPSDALQTRLVQAAQVTAFPFGIKGSIEKFLGEKFKTNAVQGRAIMDRAIERVLDEYQQAYGKLRTETEGYIRNIRGETEELCDKLKQGTEDRLDKFKQEADDVVSSVMGRSLSDRAPVYQRE